jgi:nucleoside phosphorylase
LVAALAVSLSACESDDDGGAEGVYAVLSAFPAELVPFVEEASIDETVTIDGRVVRVGRLRGVRVVLAITGIGLVNAANTTRLVLDNFAVDGVIVSGVAGSRLRIGDVSVPEVWSLQDTSTYLAHPPWLTLAEEVAAPGIVDLDNCTERPADPQAPPVCLPFEPEIAVGGLGRSDDPFSGGTFPCTPGGDDLFGCDVPQGTVALSGENPHAAEGSIATSASEPVVVDMETAAIAREATASGLPFIAFRAASDGEEDPLMLAPFQQFLVYYRLAARNAAASTMAFLDRL